LYSFFYGETISEQTSLLAPCDIMNKMKVKIMKKEKYLGGLKRPKGYLTYWHPEEWNRLVEKTNARNITIAKFIREAVEHQLRQPNGSKHAL
jgi:hypothetical protein